MNKIIKYNRIKSIFPYRVFPRVEVKKEENVKKNNIQIIKKENLAKKK
jgi:hypothetical protein